MSESAPEIVAHPAQRGEAEPDPAGGPARDEAQRRLERWRPLAASLAASHRRLGLARLGVFFVGVTLAIWLFKEHPAWAPVASIPAVVFAGLVLQHERVRGRRREADAAVAWHERTLGRLDGHWMDVGSTGEELAPKGHLYAHDLDVVGRGSVFQLFVPPPTHEGRATLARWLLEPASPDEIRARQDAVRELTPDVDLREDIGCLDEEISEHLDADALRTWAQAEPVRFASWERVVAWTLGGLAALATAAWAIGQLRGSFVMLVALVEAVPAAIAARRVLEVANRSEQVTGALRSLGRVLRPLESREPECERLRELRARMAVGEWPPSEALERLDRKAEKLVSGLRGSVHAIVAYLFQRHVPLAHVVEEERQALAERVPGWIDVAGELQALAALSGHAHEHPDHVFPEVVDGPAFLEADGLGHPLLPATQCVRNDISLDLARSLMVVSGSNMSGKSTYLRAIGLAVVLAQAGAPVRARSCRLSPLAVATSLRIADDLLSGTSHFYAEISRLADIDAGAASGLPQLVLLDEILHGTNSADRFAGARAVVARLLEQGALGLVTTHDLALAKLADEHGERVRNVHFEDTVVDGKMTFDYTVRDGVVERGNALDLMRALGLPV